MTPPYLSVPFCVNSVLSICVLKSSFQLLCLERTFHVFSHCRWVEKILLAMSYKGLGFLVQHVFTSFLWLCLSCIGLSEKRFAHFKRFKVKNHPKVVCLNIHNLHEPIQKRMPILSSFHENPAPLQCMCYNLKFKFSIKILSESGFPLTFWSRNSCTI